MSNDLEKLIINEPSNEDTIQCFFFATEANADSISWNHLCMKINIAIQSISRDYLWHKDAFEVFVPVNQTNIEGKSFLSSIVGRYLTPTDYHY